VASRRVDESADQRSTNPLISPCTSHKHAPDAAHIRTPREGIAVEASYCNDQALINVAAERLPWSIEAILSARPIVHQRLNKVIAFVLRLDKQALNTRERQLNSLDRIHQLP
jgi:hypothetical protein